VHGTVDIVATLRFIPSVEIAGFTLEEELEVDFPLTEDVVIDFPPEQMDFPAPIEPEPETTGGTTGDDSGTSAGPTTDSDSAGDSDPGDSGTTGAPDPTAGPDETTGAVETEGDTDSAGVADEGCGCSAERTRGGGAAAWSLLALLALGAGRRRR
jgi:MYXO-CTERM domain-containing protein